MITEKKITLKPILESSKGLHLTVYLVNRGDLFDLKAQLRQSLNEAHDCLKSVQTIEERERFLEPLEALLHDNRILKAMRGNVGIFRTKDSFRILNVPVDIERQCHLATSFHVKPLIRWMQIDREFLLLGLSEGSADLYLGTQTSLYKVDSILFPDFFMQKNVVEGSLNLRRLRHIRLKRERTFEWLGEWIEQMTQNSSPKLFVAGEKSLSEELIKKLKYANLVKNPVALSYGEHNVSEICKEIRKTLRFEAKKALEHALMEFRFAEELNLAKKNIFQIARAAVQGRVKKLIIADKINIFGKVDKKTGELAIHPIDLDHEDDDILDDLAQTVLASGGEVVIGPREEIPKGSPVLAILEGREPDAEKSEEKKELRILRGGITV